MIWVLSWLTVGAALCGWRSWHSYRFESRHRRVLKKLVKSIIADPASYHTRYLIPPLLEIDSFPLEDDK